VRPGRDVLDHPQEGAGEEAEERVHPRPQGPRTERPVQYD
jgi:hypothetical protein